MSVRGRVKFRQDRFIPEKTTRQDKRRETTRQDKTDKTPRQEREGEITKKERKDDRTYVCSSKCVPISPEFSLNPPERSMLQ